MSVPLLDQWAHNVGKPPPKVTYAQDAADVEDWLRDQIYLRYGISPSSQHLTSFAANIRNECAPIKPRNWTVKKNASIYIPPLDKECEASPPKTKRPFPAEPLVPLGFDCEYAPRALFTKPLASLWPATSKGQPPCLLSLATDTAALLIPLYRLREQPAQLREHTIPRAASLSSPTWWERFAQRQACPSHAFIDLRATPLLRDALVNPSICKIGDGCKSDARDLYNFFYTGLKPLDDLRDLYNKGAAELAESHFGCRVDKQNDPRITSVRCGRWDVNLLQAAELDYAAFDAWLPLQCYLRQEESSGNETRPALNLSDDARRKQEACLRQFEELNRRLMRDRKPKCLKRSENPPVEFVIEERRVCDIARVQSSSPMVPEAVMSEEEEGAIPAKIVDARPARRGSELKRRKGPGKGGFVRRAFISKKDFVRSPREPRRRTMGVGAVDVQSDDSDLYKGMSGWGVTVESGWNVQSGDYMDEATKQRLQAKSKARREQLKQSSSSSDGEPLCLDPEEERRLKEDMEAARRVAKK